MAAENTSSEAHHLFRNLYLAQPLSFDVLSSAAIAHTAESSLPIQQAPHLATALSENFIEQQNRHFESFPERPTHWMQAQAQDSPWKQIHTDLSRAPRTHSPFNYDINPPTDPSPPLQDSRLSTYLAPTSAFTNLTKMDPPMYEQHSAYSFEEPFKSLGGGSDFFDTIKPEHPSLSPLSSLASMEIDTGSPPYGSNSSYGIPLDTTRPPPPEQMEDTTGEPYARLIYRALKGAPGHRMVLKDIYNWFEMYTDKARDPKSRGWQNSIRHNLSMNGVRFSHLTLDFLTDDSRRSRKLNKLRPPRTGSVTTFGFLSLLLLQPAMFNQRRDTVSRVDTRKLQELMQPSIDNDLEPRVDELRAASTIVIAEARATPTTAFQPRFIVPKTVRKSHRRTGHLLWMNSLVVSERTLALNMDCLILRQRFCMTRLLFMDFTAWVAQSRMLVLMLLRSHRRQRWAVGRSPSKKLTTSRTSRAVRIKASEQRSSATGLPNTPITTSWTPFKWIGATTTCSKICNRWTQCLLLVTGVAKAPRRHDWSSENPWTPCLLHSKTLRFTQSKSHLYLYKKAERVVAKTWCDSIWEGRHPGMTVERDSTLGGCSPSVKWIYVSVLVLVLVRSTCMSWLLDFRPDQCISGGIEERRRWNTPGSSMWLMRFCTLRDR